ncbi:hypothetical protein H311_02140 [Anncaliia algerae PRA109]|nr:hypothetical protein H311_02140 [Anncaliia algerae PRA109]
MQNLEQSPHKTLDYLQIHNTMGHPGISTMYYTLRRFENKPNTINKIKQIVSNCTLCQKNKNTKHKYGKSGMSLTTQIPLEHISSDIFGPFDTKNTDTTNQ